MPRIDYVVRVVLHRDDGRPLETGTIPVHSTQDADLICEFFNNHKDTMQIVAIKCVKMYTSLPGSRATYVPVEDVYDVHRDLQHELDKVREEERLADKVRTVKLKKPLGSIPYTVADEDKAV